MARENSSNSLYRPYNSKENIRIGKMIIVANSVLMKKRLRIRSAKIMRDFCKSLSVLFYFPVLIVVEIYNYSFF